MWEHDAAIIEHSIRYPDSAERYSFTYEELVLLLGRVPSTFIEDEEPPEPPPHDQPFIMQFFVYAHLRPDLHAVSKPFGDLARHIERTILDNEERGVALRKLLEAKDAAVRAVIAK